MIKIIKNNLIKIFKKKNYFLEGEYFNAQNFVNNLLIGDDENYFFNKDFKIKININSIRLDDEFELNNLNGNLYFKKKNYSMEIWMVVLKIIKDEFYSQNWR